uniref:Uncharacterized protein n=2 Tax=Anguilla anguilla TaxID=7936 RepID=A0A0E9QDJ8_ANGAN
MKRHIFFWMKCLPQNCLYSINTISELNETHCSISTDSTL